jgi:heat shock transcription factor
VDTDRWEFAHESFLRGQAHLLPLVVRKKKKAAAGCRELLCEEGEEVRGTIRAVQRLREEQRGIEEELQAMDRRLRAAESRPGQMMAFLAKLADEPGVVLRAMLAKKEELAAGNGSPRGPWRRRAKGGASGPIRPARAGPRTWRRAVGAPCRSRSLFSAKCSTRVDRDRSV